MLFNKLSKELEECILMELSLIDFLRLGIENDYVFKQILEKERGIISSYVKEDIILNIYNPDNEDVKKFLKNVCNNLYFYLDGNFIGVKDVKSHLSLLDSGLNLYEEDQGEVSEDEEDQGEVSEDEGEVSEDEEDQGEVSEDEGEVSEDERPVQWEGSLALCILKFNILLSIYIYTFLIRKSRTSFHCDFDKEMPSNYFIRYFKYIYNEYIELFIDKCYEEEYYKPIHQASEKISKVKCVYTYITYMIEGSRSREGIGGL